MTVQHTFCNFDTHDLNFELLSMLECKYTYSEGVLTVQAPSFEALGAAYLYVYIQVLGLGYCASSFWGELNKVGYASLTPESEFVTKSEALYGSIFGW